MVTNSIESIIPSGYLQTNANTKACKQYRYVFEQPCLPMVILSHAGCQRLSQVWSLGCSVGWLVTHVTAWLIVAMVKDTFSYYSNMYLLRFLTRIQNGMNGASGPEYVTRIDSVGCYFVHVAMTQCSCTVEISRHISSKKEHIN